MLIASDGLPAIAVGRWAEDKHYYLERYCRMFAVGTKNKWARRYYIDLFSGPGIGIDSETRRERPGSPLIALAQQFTHFIFVEADPANLEALKVRSEPLLKGRHAKYILGDANAVLQDITQTVPQKGVLSLIFADPYTIQLKMQTIQWLSGHLRVDWLIHFPYGTHLQRVLPQTQTEMTKDKQTALDEFFGGTDWRKLRARRPNPRSYLDLYEGKLRELEYMIGDNYPRITNSKNSTLYYLVLASKSELALKFWKSVNEIGPEGQRTLF